MTLRESSRDQLCVDQHALLCLQVVCEFRAMLPRPHDPFPLWALEPLSVVIPWQYVWEGVEGTLTPQTGQSLGA